MSKALDELLFTIRQHPAYRELLEAVETPPVQEFKESGDAQKQYADYIFRSGRRRQHEVWRQFLIGETSRPPLEFTNGRRPDHAARGY